MIRASHCIRTKPTRDHAIRAKYNCQSINRVVPSLTAMIATELEVKVIECDCPFFFPSDPISGQSSTEVTIAEPLTCSSSMFMSKCLPATMLC